MFKLGAHIALMALQTCQEKVKMIQFGVGFHSMGCFEPYCFDEQIVHIETYLSELNNYFLPIVWKLLQTTNFQQDRGATIL